MIGQGNVCWADMPDPVGSGPGFRRPVLVVQSDAFNRSAIRTVVCVPLTSNQKWASSPGNVALSPRDTGLSRASVANVSQVVTLDKTAIAETIGRLRPAKLELVLGGIEILLGRE